MTNENDAFLDRLDAFATSLSPEEQLMFQALIGDDDEVDGFGQQPWPGVRTIVPAVKLGGLTNSDAFLSSGHSYNNPISSDDLGSGR